MEREPKPHLDLRLRFDDETVLLALSSGLPKSIQESMRGSSWVGCTDSRVGSRSVPVPLDISRSRVYVYIQMSEYLHPALAPFQI